MRGKIIGGSQTNIVSSQQAQFDHAPSFSLERRLWFIHMTLVVHKDNCYLKSKKNELGMYEYSIRYSMFLTIPQFFAIRDYLVFGRQFVAE